MGPDKHDTLFITLVLAEHKTRGKADEQTSRRTEPERIQIQSNPRILNQNRETNRDRPPATRTGRESQGGYKEPNPPSVILRHGDAVRADAQVVRIGVAEVDKLVCEIFDLSTTLSIGSSDVKTSSTLEQSTVLLTFGLNGGWTCFARGFFQSTERVK
jgi:hypothetical protein